MKIVNENLMNIFKQGINHFQYKGNSFKLIPSFNSISLQVNLLIRQCF